MRRLRLSVIALGLAMLATPLQGQTLRQRFSDLFTFGNCGEALCLDVNSEVHGNHYNPSVTQGEQNLLFFVTNAIGLSVANLPFTAATSGVTFTFEGGVPVANQVSPGPIFAERAQTLGQGRLLLAASQNAIVFDNLRGVPLDQLRFRFTHQNVGGAALGDPIFENDVIEVDVDMKMTLLVATIFASYGVTDRIDVAVGVPLMRASLSGESSARVDQFTDPSPHTFGTTSDPTPTASATTSGSAFGIGDLTARIKMNLTTGSQYDFAIAGDVRLPTGDENDFLGSGATVIRGLGILSATYGDFSPHLNAGVLITDAEYQNNRLLGTAGFDHLMSEAVTLAVDFVGSMELGDALLSPPAPVVFTSPDVRTIALSTIPDRSDHFLDASFGFKFTTAGGWRIVTNALFPLLEGGFRPRSMWTLGLERAF